jgi:hypothetical protein
MQSVTITTKVVSSNPVNSKVYSIQHYVIKFVSDLRQVGGFLRFDMFFKREKKMKMPACCMDVLSITHSIISFLLFFFVAHMPA